MKLPRIILVCCVLVVLVVLFLVCDLNLFHNISTDDNDNSVNLSDRKDGYPTFFGIPVRGITPPARESRKPYYQSIDEIAPTVNQVLTVVGEEESTEFANYSLYSRSDSTGAYYRVSFGPAVDLMIDIDAVTGRVLYATTDQRHHLSSPPCDSMDIECALLVAKKYLKAFNLEVDTADFTHTSYSPGLRFFCCEELDTKVFLFCGGEDVGCIAVCSEDGSLSRYSLHVTDGKELYSKPTHMR